ncbi:hypothetical protein [Burkholderia vietnamiensis]|uniref:hypothetical protein n=1 Tax=Burkholderia vietnamiensis TaxID=60552 RepID=UPI0015938D7B|nr:hypothetical protein [Burkholderia vietnamiensis]
MTAYLYQLTATAAQMCLPVPIPAAAPHGFLNWLDHWQPLIGATAGGLLGVAGAWIVAGSARSRERRVAAGTSIEAAVEADQRIAGNHELVKGDTRAWLVVEKLARRRPSLFALHTPATGQLSDIDARLYCHLFQCQMIHRTFDEGMAQRLAGNETRTELGVIGGARFVRGVLSDARLYREWQGCVERATLANYFLDRFVFSRWPRWCHRLRMKFFPNDHDRRSAALIQTGTLPAAGGEASVASAAPA